MNATIYIATIRLNTFLGILSFTRYTITNIGTVKNNGWYVNASLMCPCNSDIKALVIPHPAHDIPVRYFMGHDMFRIFNSMQYKMM